MAEYVNNKVPSQEILRMGGEPRRFVMDMERTKVGDPAIDVFREVVGLNPWITDVSVVVYDPGNDSVTGHMKQGPIWLPKGVVFDEFFLKSFSEAIYENTRNSSMIAVGSLVSLGYGKTMHIPMMDFSFPSNQKSDVVEESLMHISELFSAQRGALLNSGQSFHFWSPNLMTQEKWNDFMANRLQMEKNRVGLSVPVYDVGSIESSLERGFSALRIFGYDKSDKETTPTVVSLIK